MQNLSCENEFYLYDNKTRFHINAFALMGLQITVGYRTLADHTKFASLVSDSVRALPLGGSGTFLLSQK